MCIGAEKNAEESNVLPMCVFPFNIQAKTLIFTAFHTNVMPQEATPLQTFSFLVQNDDCINFCDMQAI
jgi:hypothetical protein